MNIIERELEAGSKHNIPKMIVIHSMGEHIDTRYEVNLPSKDRKIWFAPNWLDYLGLSVHGLFMPNGDVMVCKYDRKGAYHAKGHNTNTLGYEFLVKGVYTYATFRARIKQDWVLPKQWESGVEFVKDKVEMYDIKNIQRHSDLSPKKKVDPGSGFKWEQFKQEIGV